MYFLFVLDSEFKKEKIFFGSHC